MQELAAKFTIDAMPAKILKVEPQRGRLSLTAKSFWAF
jgi:hypothetical protein